MSDMHRLTILIAAIALAGCGSANIDRTARSGVGFGTLADLQPVEAQGAPAITGPFVAAGQISDESLNTIQTTLLQPIDTTTAETTQTTEVLVTETQIPSVDPNNPSISDEQDFDAVASRESIESDRERLAAQAEAYQVIQPGELPTRSGGAEPSIVEFALAVTHPAGAKIYTRSAFSTQARFNRNCAKYASSDHAQAAFLKAGGPTRDRFGIDPDGDGYACYWDPTPFRAALGQ